MTNIKAKIVEKKTPSRDARHLMRYLKNRGGMSLVEIAQEEKVNLRQVRESVNQTARFEATNSEGQLQLAVRDLIISTMPQAKLTFENLLKATNTEERPNLKTGQKERVMVPDKTTQLEAMRVMTGLVAATQPKVPLTQVNVQQTNQTANLNAKGESNEDRMRRLREMALNHNALPALVAAVPEHIDAGGEADLDDDEDEEE